MTLQRYTRSAATVSWIDPRLWWLIEVDHVPPKPEVDRRYLTGNAGYRFDNFLEAWVDVDQSSGTIMGAGFSSQSGMYRAPSFGGFPSYAFTRTAKRSFSGSQATFMQVVGARTQSPEIIGSAVGHAIQAGLEGPLAPVIDKLLPQPGQRAGTGAARRVTKFPPIWSELTLTVTVAAGKVTARSTLGRCSLFPSLNTYVQHPGTEAMPDPTYVQTALPWGAANYDARSNLSNWRSSGWGALRGGSLGPTPGNPWGFTVDNYPALPAGS